MDIICIFKKSIYYKVEPFLFEQFRAYVSQKKLENGNFELVIGCLDSDTGDIVRYILRQPNFVSLTIEPND